MKIISIVGPTASGKTNLAVKLAQKIGGEIISADSRLVYRDFNIGTAKPTIEEMWGIPHYLIDVADPREDYSVELYKKEAKSCIDDVLSRGKVPIITGGTGLYVKALLEGLDIPKVKPDEEYRKELDEIAENKGREFLHKKLAELDPVIAEKLHYNDKFRVIRALEVIKACGKPMSEVQKKKEPDYDVLYIGLNSENRDFLYERVNKRVDIMLENGLVSEVEDLMEKYGKTVSLMKTLGYKEICEYLDGALELDEARELIKKNTRNYAKRQLTWFRANKKIHWFYIDTIGEKQILEGIVGLYNV